MKYHPSEIDGILSTMEIIVDTREQNTAFWMNSIKKERNKSSPSMNTN